MSATVGPFAANLTGQAPSRRRLDHLVIANDLLAVWDVAASVGCGYVGILFYSLIFRHGAPAVRLDGPLLGEVLLGSLVCALVLRDPALSTLAGYAGRRWLPRGALRRVALCLCVLGVVVGLTRSLLDVSTAWWLSWSLLSLACSLAARSGLTVLVRQARSAGRLREAVAVVGGGPVAERLATRLARMGQEPVELVGQFDSTESGAAGGLASIEQLIDHARSRPLDAVVIALPEAERDRLPGLLWQLNALSIQIALCPELATGEELHRYRVLNGVPLALAVDKTLRNWNAVAKRTEDVVVAGLMLLVSLPVMALIALAVRLEDGGPVLFRQRRDGWNGRDFTMLKFRTMRVEANPAGTLQQTRRGDPRVTGVGAFLRRSSLDELPQLLNVLAGEMSVVGPRPHAVTMRTENRLGHEIIAEYAQRQRMKPGITGLAQVNGLRGATDTAEQLRRRVHQDLLYIEGWSLLLDLKVLALTALRVLGGQNAF